MTFSLEDIVPRLSKHWCLLEGRHGENHRTNARQPREGMEAEKKKTDVALNKLVSMLGIKINCFVS